MVFLNSISYSFYPLVILVFIFILILSKKDFGPMLKFEKAVDIKEGTELNREHSIDAIWAIIPIALLLFVTILGIYLSGSRGEGFMQAIQTGNCYTGLIWGSAAFLLVSVLISFFAGNTLSSVVVWVFDGMKSLFSALTVLVLAWALTAVLKDLQLGLYLGELMHLSNMPFVFIPIITFVLAAIIAFSTGSSFSTMGILVPIVVTVCISFYSSNSFELSVFYASIASVLSGAVLGDHCSPISDTTILSSMATGCDHINHVNSQLTYCLLCGGIAVLLILLNVWIGLNLLFSYVVGVLLIYLIINVLGRDS
jgi:Na+/H+ antiporter NhaC